MAEAVAEQILDIAIEKADAKKLRDKLQLLNNDGHDEELIADIADILALLAAQRGHADIIPVLTEHGAMFHATDMHRGGPPLMHAAHNGHSAAVAALLKVCKPDIADQKRVADSHSCQLCDFFCYNAGTSRS